MARRSVTTRLMTTKRVRNRSTGKRIGVKPKRAHSTYERDYTDEENEVLVAAQKYKESKRLKYMDITEMLRLLKELGYEKRPEAKGQGRYD